MRRLDRERSRRALAVALALALGASMTARAESQQSPAEPPVATITVSSATAGSSLGGQLVEGVMRYRDRDYLLTLHGVAKSVTTRGSVFALPTVREIEGIYRRGDQGLKNASGVLIRFDPPLELESDRLEIELSGGMQPKVSRGHRESGVD